MKKISRLLLAFWLLTGYACAAGQGGVVVFVEGNVQLSSTGGGDWRSLASGQRLSQGDLVQTGTDGRAGIRLDDESLVRLNRNSRFELSRVDDDGGFMRSSSRASGSLYRLGWGELWLRNNNPAARIDIETPTVVAGIRGTEIGIRIEPSEKVLISILEGQVIARNTQGQITAVTGEAISTSPGEAPVKLLLLNPKDAVQWTIRLPEPWKKLLYKPSSPIPRAMFNNDWLGALKALQQAVSQTPDNAELWRLLSLNALLLDRRKLALGAANRSLQLDADNAIAWLMKGYVKQAEFDLAEALKAYEQALARDPENVTVLINKARVLFGDDRLEQARAVSQKILSLAPRDAQALTMSGFIDLAEGKTDAAITSFKQAASIDSGHADAYLGEAIALMRKGLAEQAFDAVATAVLLAPRRSLYLSYWGKMLYQVKRPARAINVLDSAHRADPLDPTPLFYKAIIIRDQNRPGEAIKLLNQAVALNDKRGVYRSRFLLDRDMATRNVDLSLAYSSLGLNAWAENKALASVKRDYFNAAGHVFYAGALSGQEGRSRVFANEALLGRVLQPANFNTFNTYNDYTTLFEQPDIAGNLLMNVGNDETAGAQLIAYGASPETGLAYSASLSANQTDGWRGDNGSRLRGAGIRLKWEPTLKDNLSLSLRTNDSIRDDRFRNSISGALQQSISEEETDAVTTEISYHRRIAADSNLLFNATFYEYNGDSSLQNQTPITLNSGDPATVYTFEETASLVDFQAFQLQWLKQLGSHQLILGGIHYDGDKGADFISQNLVEVAGNFFFLTDFDRDTNFQTPVTLQTAYIQDIWQMSDDLTLEAALYAERMETANVFSGARWNINEINPRLGLIWQVSEKDTLRIAAFRYLLPFVFPRLDPADIAGVPLYRNSDEGSIVEEYDLVWEHEWSSGFVSGNLFSMNKKAPERVPLANGGSLDINYQGSLQGLQLAYNQLLGDEMGLAIGYRYVESKDDLEPLNDRDEHSARLALRMVKPSGFSAGVSQTFRDIDFHGQRDDKFFGITDIALSFELPDKQGSVGLQVNNIFDRRFEWVTDRFVLQSRTPAREVLATLSLNF